MSSYDTVAASCVAFTLGSLLFLLPAMSHATEGVTYVNNAIANPNVAGVYWQSGTDSNGDVQVTGVSVDNQGNVVDVTQFDAEGNYVGGESTNAEESLGEYIDRTEGDHSTSGFYDPSDPFSDPYACWGFNCPSGADDTLPGW